MAAKRQPADSRPALADADAPVLDVTVVLLDGGYASTAIAPLEVFHAAGQLWNWLQGVSVRPRFRVRLASIGGRNVTCGYPLGLTPECAIEDIEHTDIIIVPTSGWDVMERIAQTSALVPWLKEWHARGAYIAAVCTGVMFLAEAGLLDGRQATTHWGVAEIFRRRYPKVRWHTERFVTEDGRLFCSGGIYASIDLSLCLVEKFCGREIALQTAKSLLLSMPRSRQSGYAMVPLSQPHADEKIKRAEEYLHENFDRDLSIETLAGRVGMSPRNFIRRFKAATGRLPGAYVQMLRVSTARDLLERGAQSVQTLSSKIGYEDVAFFRRLFKRHTGMTPAEYRECFSNLSLDRGELVAGRSTA